METLPSVSHLSRDKPSSKAGRSAGAKEELDAWLFIGTGRGLTLIVVAVLVMVGIHHYSADSVPVALGVLVGFSIAMWGGIALVAIPRCSCSGCGGPGHVDGRDAARGFWVSRKTP